MEVGKKLVEDLDVALLMVNVCLTQTHFAVNFHNENRSSFSDQFPPRIGISFLKD